MFNPSTEGRTSEFKVLHKDICSISFCLTCYVSQQAHVISGQGLSGMELRRAEAVNEEEERNKGFG